MYLKTFFVPNWTSTDSKQFRIKEYKKLTETILNVLTLCDTVHSSLSYTEIISLEYPDFVYIKAYLQKKYDELMHDLEEQRKSH